MTAAATWRLGPREDSPRPAPPPEKLPPREPVTPVKLRQALRRLQAPRAQHQAIASGIVSSSSDFAR